MKKSDIGKDINIIIDRLKSIVGVKEDKELADIFQVSPNTFSTWKIRGKQIPLDLLIDFCNNFDISLEFALLGKKVDENNIVIPFIEDLNEDIYYQYSHSTKSITIPIVNILVSKTHKLMCFQTIDNQLPLTAPKGSFVIIDLGDKNAGWGCELFLISTDYGYLLRKLIAIPAEAENYEFILKSENEDIDNFKLSKFKIIGKVVGAVKWDF